MSKLKTLSNHIQHIYGYAEDPEQLPLLLHSLEKIPHDELEDSDFFDLLEPHFSKALKVARLRDFSAPSIEAASIILNADLDLISGNPEGISLLAKTGIQAHMGDPICEQGGEFWEILTSAKERFCESANASFVYVPETGKGLVGRFTPYAESKNTQFRLQLLAWGPDCPIDLSGLESFDLTKAERRLVSHLARGKTLTESAQIIGVSENTVRTQVKSVYLKTGCKSLPSLIAMTHMSSTLARLTAPHHSSDTTGAIPRRRFYYLRNNRRLAYRIYGDACGAPILVLTGGFAASYMNESMGQAAKKRGLKLTVPDRPGTGQSDRDPGRTWQSWATDLTDFITNIIAQPVSILVNAHMAKSAMAVAQNAPDLVKSILFFNPRLGKLGADSDPKQDQYSFGQRLMNLALKQPKLVTPCVKLFLKQTPAHIRAKMVRTILSSTPSDTEFLDDPSNMQNMIAILNDGQIETSVGFADDIAMLLYTQDFKVPKTIQCEAWFAAELGETSYMKATQKAIPNIVCKSIPNSGLMLFHARFTAALDWFQ